MPFAYGGSKLSQEVRLDLNNNDSARVCARVPAYRLWDLAKDAVPRISGIVASEVSMQKCPVFEAWRRLESDKIYKIGRIGTFRYAQTLV